MQAKREPMSVVRFGLMVLMFLIGGAGLYMGIQTWGTEPSLSWTLPLKDEVIAIDAGHGGVDPGAVSASGLVEKDITLAIAEKLRDLLQQAGAQVVMTREVDRDLAPAELKGYSKRKNADLHERVQLIQREQAGLLISLHGNAVPESKWSGALTIYDSKFPESKLVAANIQESLRENLNMSRSIVETDNVYILKRAELPGALVELGFLSNPEEAQRLTQRSYQEKLAMSIYLGLLKYYEQQKRVVVY